MHAFLSHSGSDKPAVEELARRLLADGIEVWLDKWNLVPGNPWDVEIEKALAECDVCVVFFGPSGLGPWHNEEMRLAIRRRVQDKERRLRVLPVILPGGMRVAESQLPGFLQGTTWVEFRQSLDEPESFRRLKCGILNQAPGYEPDGAPLVGHRPYVGLKAFRQEDAPLFFGRDALLQQILARQGEGFGTPREARFLALIGPSGSGKSSFAAAGLLPAILEAEALPNGRNWLCVRCRPSGDPWESLQVALASHSETARHLAALDTLIKEPEQESHRLHLLSRLVLHDRPETHRLIVFVDQFEEFFSLYQGERDPDRKLAATRRRFLDNLLYPATVPDSRLLIVLTMRADFYGNCATYPGLREAVSENQVLIGPLSPAELREAIERPAQLCGCEVEPALVERLLDDMERQPGALPFLQHALLKLWEARDGRRLTSAAYREMGNLEGALDAHSEAFFASLPDDQQKLVRSVLLDLIQLGEGAADTKRRKSLDQLADGDLARLHPFIAKLASAHLVVTDQVAGEVHVELSHETLITGWKKLHSWIDESRDEKRLKDRLEQAANEWLNADNAKRSDFLWRGAQLEGAEFALASFTLALNEDALSFLAACRDLRDHESAQRELAAQRERDQQRRLEEAETARVRAEARAEIERVQEIERRRLEAIAAAQTLKERADKEWAKLRDEGTRRGADWRLTRLADLESLLVETLTLDREAPGTAGMLTNVRQCLVETGIQTQDLNLASIYLQKLKAGGGADAGKVSLLGDDLQGAWTQADPSRNPYVRRMRKWALIGSWLPLIWTTAAMALAASKDEDGFFIRYLAITGLLSAALHGVAALFALMAAAGDQRMIRFANITAVMLFFAGLFALNLLSCAIATVIVRTTGAIPMQKLLWSRSAELPI